MARTPSTAREHVLTGIVAVAVVALGLLDGGYPTGVYAGVTLAIWWGVVALIALGVRERRQVPIEAIVAGAALVGLALLAGLSLAWASDDGRAFAEMVRAAGYAGLFVLVVLIARRGDGGGWLTGLAIGFAAVALLALSSRLLPGLPGGDDEISQIIPGPLARLSYPIGYWNGLSACMAMGVVLLMWLGAAARAPLARALATGGIPICALVVYMASSRGAALAAALGLATLVILSRDRLPLLGGAAIAGVATIVLIALTSARQELLDGLTGEVVEDQGTELLFFTLFIVGAVVAARWALDDELRRLEVPSRLVRPALIGLAVVVVAALVVADPAERLDEFNDPPAEEVDTSNFVASHITSGTGNGRWQYWEAAIDAFEEDPLKGVGAGGYEAFWFQHGSLPRPIRDAHSLFLESLGELGLLGLGVVLTFFGAAAIGATRRPADREMSSVWSAAIALLVAGVVVAAIDWMWEIPVVFAPVVISAALLTGPALRAGDSARAASRYGWGVATLVAGWLAICASGILLATELKLDDSHEAVRDEDLSQAARDAQDAIALELWAAEPRLQLALVEERGGDFSAARDHVGEAIDRAPDDWRLWLVAARIETRAGEIEAAEKALARARELNPRSPILVQTANRVPEREQPP